MSGKASTLLHDLFFLPLFVLLTGCITSGGEAGAYSCDDVGGNAPIHCSTGEPTDLFNYWAIVCLISSYTRFI